MSHPEYCRCWMQEHDTPSDTTRFISRSLYLFFFSLSLLVRAVGVVVVVVVVVVAVDEENMMLLLLLLASRQKQAPPVKHDFLGGIW